MASAYEGTYEEESWNYGEGDGDTVGFLNENTLVVDNVILGRALGNTLIVVF